MEAFDHNKTHIAPVGVKVIIHEKPATRQSWAIPGINGWYIGPAMEHYRCHKVYATKTIPERVSDIVEFYLQDLPIPKTSSTDMEIKAAAELIYALQNPTPSSPFHKFGDEILRALDKLGYIFSKSHPTKEDKEEQTSQKQLPLTVAAPIVENITPPKTNIIPQIEPKMKYVVAPRVIDPKEKTSPWGNKSPVPALHIIENDMNDTPTTTPTPASSNKDDYNQQIAPRIIPDDRKHHRYNTRYAKGYA